MPRRFTLAPAARAAVALAVAAAALVPGTTASAAGPPSTATVTPGTGEARTVATGGAAGCAVGTKLVPTCNILWGAAAGGFSDTPRDQALREWEQKSGRPAAIYHSYHRGDELFPTRAEIAMARDRTNPRLLMINWKVAYGTTWAKVAAGERDARIDRLAGYLKATFTEPFFLVPHHEPENDVVATAGSGMTAGDYAAMFAHTMRRLRAQGVHNAVSVVAFMGLEKFYNQPWWYDLYPGDDVVDWIGLDAYVAAKPGGYHYGTLSSLLNRTTDRRKFPGFYTWSQTRHADKPMMLSEWGVHEYAADPTQKAKILSTVRTELANFPAVKGMVWFDTAQDQNGSDIRIDSSPLALAEFRAIAADPRFAVRIGPPAAGLDSTAPQVSITAPTGPSRRSGTVTVSVDAADASGIAKVELLVAGRVVATDAAAPWALPWRSAGSDGAVLLTVRATDRAGNVGSAQRQVTVDNTGPAFASAAQGPQRPVRGRVPVPVRVTDPSGVARVELLAGGRVVGVDSAAPYAPRWNSGRANGRVTLTVRAYDRLGNAAVSRRPVLVDNRAPALRVTSAPRTGRWVRRVVPVRVAARDAHGVARVEALVDGRVVARDTRGPFRLRVRTTGAGRRVNLWIRAYDRAGNVRYAPRRTWYR